MDLVLQATGPAPSKKDWHDPSSTARKDWLDIYEATTSWFCSSHDFNKEDNLIVLIGNSLIKFEGSSLRYLGPSLRSAASLHHKAYQKLQELDNNEIAESTPGIYIYKNADLYQLPQPYYQLQLGQQISADYPTTGSLFCFTVAKAQEYYVPATRISQGLIWFLQDRFT